MLCVLAFSGEGLQSLLGPSASHCCEFGECHTGGVALKFLDRKDDLGDTVESAYGGGVASLGSDCGCEMELFPR